MPLDGQSASKRGCMFTTFYRSVFARRSLRQPLCRQTFYFTCRYPALPASFKQRLYSATAPIEVKVWSFTK